MNYRSSSTNTLFTNLEAVDVNVHRVGLIRAWVYQIPFLKSIHFNVVSEISKKGFTFSYLLFLASLKIPDNHELNFSVSVLIYLLSN